MKDDAALMALNTLRIDLLDTYTIVTNLLSFTVVSRGDQSTDGFYATDFVDLMDERMDKIKADILLLTVFGDV